MSHSTLVEVKKGSSPIDIMELRNGHGSAPVIWDSMFQRYVDGNGRYWEDENMDKLWPLHKDKTIPASHRAVLMMTFDTAIVRKENFPIAAADIRSFMAEFPPNPEHVNHWPRIAEYYESNPDISALGIHHTSVSENPFDGEWDEEAEEYGPTDWDSVYEIYETIKQGDCPESAEEEGRL
jgi:hypothetical protein